MFNCVTLVCAHNRVAQTVNEQSASTDNDFASIVSDPCRYVSCEHPQVCRLDYERRARCVCSEFCGEDYAPVCGSDGRTYANECLLRRQACRTMPGLRIVFRGRCDQGNGPEPNHGEHPRCLFPWRRNHWRFMGLLTDIYSLLN